MSSVGDSVSPLGRDYARLTEVLAAHTAWLQSGGTQGQRASFSGEKLPGIVLSDKDLRRADFVTADVSGASFARANLRQADFRGANVSGADFTKSNLQDAYLSEVIGLGSRQLAGSDVSGASLPEAIGKFEGLVHVREVAKKAAQLFTLVVLGCAYAWLTIFTTNDVRLLTNSSTSPLPIIQTQIPIAGFYVVAPWVLIALSIYLHLFLQRLWNELGDLPAVFVDGQRLDEKLYPWLPDVTPFGHPVATSRTRPLFSFLEGRICVFLAWWVVPATILGFWLRYLPRHDWPGTVLHVCALAAAIVLGAWFRWMAVGALRIRYRPLFLHPIVPGALALLVSLITSYGAINGERREPGYWYEDDAPGFAAALRRTVPTLLPFLASRAFADIRDQDVSTKPMNWFFRSEAELPEITTRAQLRAADLRGASAQAAFLVKADLRDARLSNANFSRGLFQAADLQDAQLQKTYLFRAKFQGAKLSNADLREAYLGEAHLEAADLRQALLQGSFLIGAHLENSDLRMAQLQGALLTRAHFEGAKLFGAQLQGANLEYAIGLLQQQVDEACVDGRTIIPRHLVRPRPCEGLPHKNDVQRDSAAVHTTPPKLPACVGGLCTITIKSDARMMSVAIGEPGEPTGAIVKSLDIVAQNLDLGFQPVLVGRLWTFTPTPSDSPAGTEVIHIPPGDGRSGFFKSTFILPERFSAIKVVGRANIDDTGRVFVNRTPISPSIFCVGSRYLPTQYGNAEIFADDPTLFHPGLNEILISVANVGGGPSGGAFYFAISYSLAGPPGKASGKAQSRASHC